MDWKEVGAKIAKAAPILGSILGGPLGGGIGGVVALLASAFGLNPEEVTPEKINECLIRDPQAINKIQEIETQNRPELQRIALELEKAYLQDRADARARQVAVTKATGQRETNLYVIAWTFVAGFFASIIIMMWLVLNGKMPADMPQYVTFLLGSLFGTLTAGVTAIIQYFFGSSKGSAEKTKLLVARDKAPL